jgi:hypothetical protein
MAVIDLAPNPDLAKYAKVAQLLKFSLQAAFSRKEIGQDHPG